MKGSWHRERPTLFDEVRTDVGRFCTTLHVFVADETVRVRGTFPVRHGVEVLDEYRIEIELPPDYPDKLPIVREIGGRIPWEADRHISTDGSACVLLPEDRWWVFPPNKPFFDYLTVPLHNYFLAQSVVEGGGAWPFRAHEH